MLWKFGIVSRPRCRPPALLCIVLLAWLPSSASFALQPLAAGTSLQRSPPQSDQLFLRRDKESGGNSSSDASSSDVATETQEVAPKAVVHFLFLVNNSVQHVRLWRRFFSKAPPGTWKVWVHCNDEDACERHNVFAGLGAEKVPSVPTRYCTDLVSAPVAMLRQALDAKVVPAGTLEKFALVSESTLPVKPFSEVYKALTEDNNSDLCIAPANEWRGAHVDGIKVLLVKHSQWFVLNREHAQVLVKEWKPPHSWDSFMGWWTVPLKGGSWAKKGARTVSASRFLTAIGGTYACTDEQAVFATIFGGLEPDHQTGRKVIPGLGELNMNGQATDPQGRCRTFTVFQNTKDLGNLTDNIMGAVKNDTATSVYQAQDTSHPLLLQCAGRRTLAALRASPFLFARKFGSSGNDNADDEDVGAEFAGDGAHPCGDGTSYPSMLLQESAVPHREPIIAARVGLLEEWGSLLVD